MMISDIVKWALIFIVALVLQTSFVPVIIIAGIKPDLLIISLFFFSIRYGIMPGIFVGFAIGLGQDLYSPSLLGQNALTKTVAGAFIGLFNERTMRSDPLIKTVLLLVVFLVHDSLFFLVQIARLGDPLSTLFVGLLTKCLPRALYSIAVAVLFYIWDLILKPAIRK
jgi:rod shape-determining protein MreD